MQIKLTNTQAGFFAVAVHNVRHIKPGPKEPGREFVHVDLADVDGNKLTVYLGIEDALALGGRLGNIADKIMAKGE